MRHHHRIAGALAGYIACAGSLLAGQEMIVPVSELVAESQLVAVIQVKKVTQVDVPTGKGVFCRIFVAHAVIREAIKSDRGSARKERQIAIVGSTLPESTAVWKPIEKGRYLAFLKNNQGHYRYGMNWALRRIGEKDTVQWYDYELGDAGPRGFVDLELKDAILRIRKANKSQRAKPR